jgi:hypothetical protein
LKQKHTREVKFKKKENQIKDTTKCSIGIYC